MRSIEISSLPLKNVIADISAILEVPYTENCSLYELRLPESIGTGVIVGIDFDDGLGLIRYDCTFHMDIQFEFTVNKVHPLKFLFCELGSITHSFSDETVTHELPLFKNAIVASSSHNGHVVRFQKGLRTIWNSLELDRRRFQSKVSCELNELNSNLRNLLNDITAKKTFYHEGFYSLELAEIFKVWSAYKTDKFLKKLELEGSAYRILTLQILQFQDDLKNDGNKTLLRKAELNQMVRAIEIIEENLDNLPRIDEIAIEVGLNEKKLQQGFKEIVGRTVNGYIRQKRLSKAKTLLLNTDYTLSYISSAIGYNSSSYFSKIFREEFGVGPSEFKRNSKNTKIALEDMES
ncbi:MAG: AraC family transcriptional regulator [Maribacter sp.]